MKEEEQRAPLLLTRVPVLQQRQGGIPVFSTQKFGFKSENCCILECSKGQASNHLCRFAKLVDLVLQGPSPTPHPTPPCNPLLVAQTHSKQSPWSTCRIFDRDHFLAWALYPPSAFFPCKHRGLSCTLDTCFSSAAAAGALGCLHPTRLLLPHYVSVTLSPTMT